METHNMMNWKIKVSCLGIYYITEQNFTVLGLRHFNLKRQYWSIIGKIDRMAENNIFHYRYLLWMIENVYTFFYIVYGEHTLANCVAVSDIEFAY